MSANETEVEQGLHRQEHSGRREAAGGIGLSSQGLEKLRQLRAQIGTSFAQVTMALMNVPRYRHQSLVDLEWLVLEPLMRNRIAIASAKPAEGSDGSLVGIAYWASVSEEVGAKIEEQVRGGSFPVRLKPTEWDCGDQVWLLDVIAPNRSLASAVLANFGQVAGNRRVHVHPIVSRLVDPKLLRKLGGGTPPRAEPPPAAD